MRGMAATHRLESQGLVLSETLKTQQGTAATHFLKSTTTGVVSRLEMQCQ